MQLVDVDLGSELDHVPEADIFFSISDKECLRHERCVFIENLGFQQAVKVSLASVFALIIAGLKVVRIRVIDVLNILIEDLELQEIDTLLKEIDIPEALQVQYEFCSCSV